MTDSTTGAPADTAAWQPQSFSLVHGVFAVAFMLCLAMCVFTIASQS